MSYFTEKKTEHFSRLLGVYCPALSVFARFVLLLRHILLFPIVFDVHCKHFSRHFDDNSIVIFFFTTMSSELLGDNAVIHVMCIGNLNLLDDFVVTYDDRVVN